MPFRLRSHPRPDGVRRHDGLLGSTESASSRRQRSRGTQLGVPTATKELGLCNPQCHHNSISVGGWINMRNLVLGFAALAALALVSAQAYAGHGYAATSCAPPTTCAPMTTCAPATTCGPKIVYRAPMTTCASCCAPVVSCAPVASCAPATTCGPRVHCRPRIVLCRPATTCAPPSCCAPVTTSAPVIVEKGEVVQKSVVQKEEVIQK